MNCIFKVMNYLAHAYLSYNEPSVLVGNMISDFVKGKQKLVYPVNIQHGIQLHREIDSFTDTHEITSKAKEFFRPAYRLYSGPIVDIIYDHFLATDEELFSPASLYQFSVEVYNELERQSAYLPGRFLHMLTYMKADNWLYYYRTKEGIQRSLTGMVRRAAFIDDSTIAFQIFLQHYDELRELYRLFFPDVKQMAKQNISRFFT